MSTYSRREVTKTTIEYVVPADFPLGAPGAEVSKAMIAALAEVRTLHNRREDDAGWDDDLRVVPRDDEIVIAFDVPHTSVTVRATAAAS